jgi:uncharacterized DUF497 family protein
LFPENRWNLIGLLGNRVVVVTFTFGNEVIILPRAAGGNVESSTKF